MRFLGLFPFGSNGQKLSCFRNQFFAKMFQKETVEASTTIQGIYVALTLDTFACTFRTLYIRMELLLETISPEVRP